MFETANLVFTATWPAVQQCYAFRLFAASCIATCFMILAPTVAPAALVLFMRGFSGTLAYIIMYGAIASTILLSAFRTCYFKVLLGCPCVRAGSSGVIRFDMR